MPVFRDAHGQLVKAQEEVTHVSFVSSAAPNRWEQFSWICKIRELTVERRVSLPTKLVSTITNRGRLRKNRAHEASEQLRLRWDRILALMVLNGHEAVVLGAYGCGEGRAPALVCGVLCCVYCISLSINACTCGGARTYSCQVRLHFTGCGRRVPQ